MKKKKRKKTFFRRLYGILLLSTYDKKKGNLKL